MKMKFVSIGYKMKFGFFIVTFLLLVIAISVLAVSVHFNSGYNEIITSVTKVNQLQELYDNNLKDISKFIIEKSHKYNQNKYKTNTKEIISYLKEHDMDDDKLSEKIDFIEKLSSTFFENVNSITPESRENNSKGVVKKRDEAKKVNVYIKNYVNQIISLQLDYGHK